MKDALERAFESDGAEQRSERGVDRILEAAFFRKRPLQAGTCPVIDLDDRRRERRP